jgi:hypothetical protein
MGIIKHLSFFFCLEITKNGTPACILWVLLQKILEYEKTPQSKNKKKILYNLALFMWGWKNWPLKLECIGFILGLGTGYIH